MKDFSLPFKFLSCLIISRSLSVFILYLLYSNSQIWHKSVGRKTLLSFSGHKKKSYIDEFSFDNKEAFSRRLVGKVERNGKKRDSSDSSVTVA